MTRRVHPVIEAWQLIRGDNTGRAAYLMLIKVKRTPMGWRQVECEWSAQRFSDRDADRVLFFDVESARQACDRVNEYALESMKEAVARLEETIGEQRALRLGRIR